MPRETRSRILVVDDDPRLRKLLTRFLGAQGFEVDTAVNALEMDRQLRKHRTDLLLLDVMMPGENGFSVCQRVREADRTIGIIMLTAKGDDVDRIVGLKAGADDYIPKPFNPEELTARIDAVLRRRTPAVARGAAAGGIPQRVRFGPFLLNLSQRTLSKAGQAVTLSTSEFELLKVFVSHAGEPLSREALADLAQLRDHGESSRSLDVRVSRLRRVLGDDPEKPRIIKTVWGFGYVLLPAVSAEK